MKKRYYILLSSLVVLIISIGFLLFHFQSLFSIIQEKEPVGTLNFEPIKVSKGALNISIDPRIELLMSIQLEADCPMVSKLESNYKIEMKNYFKKFKNHESVESFKNLQQIGFDFHIPPSTMMHLSKNLTINEKTPFDEEILERAGGNKKVLDTFISQYGDYAMESKFKEFYDSHKDFYTKLVAKVNDSLDHDLAKDLNEYYGTDKKSYTLILSPTMHNGGFAHKIKNSAGEYDIYGFMGPSKLDNEELVFSKEIMSEIIWHEFSHSFINPLTEKHIDEINDSSKLFVPINEIMTRQSYGNWEACVNEHIIRAITARLNHKYFGEKSAKDALREGEEKGFIYISDLYNKLEEYESNRDKYKNFEAFYPELTKVFKDLSNKK